MTSNKIEVLQINRGKYNEMKEYISKQYWFVLLLSFL